jgi:hypothetical protein
VEEKIQRARLRFMSMLESAEQAAQWAAQDRPGVLQPSSLMVAAAKAMNRAGGFLEAVIIILPELGTELLDEFETFGARVGSLFQATEANAGRRIAGGRNSRNDRRAQDRRLGPDRRGRSMEIAVERRLSPVRRAEPDRRTGEIRDLADRRWRAIRH